MSRRSRRALVALPVVVLAAVPPVPPARPAAIAPRAAPPLAVPNDNRAPGGTLHDGVRTLHLEARVVGWRPDADVDSALTVQAFGERGEPTSIPGPLLRATEGAAIVVTVANHVPDSTLVVHGLRAGTVADDTIAVAPGATRELRFRAGAPGTYLYWGTTTGASLPDRWGRDAQLTGAIVIDPAGAAPDTAERVLVMTLVDIYGDSIRGIERRPPSNENVWELAINGRSWPHTERLRYAVGDTVRWRVLNGTELSHPMHLHGFHFRVLAKGSGLADTTYAATATRLAVTELLEPGATTRLEWVPTRAGNWLFHCHMLPHVTPFPRRPPDARGHDVHGHDATRHALTSMAGLVLGVTTVERGAATSPAVGPVAPDAARHVRLLAQEARTEVGRPRRRGFVVDEGPPPAADSIRVPGPPLVLTRGERTTITVVNRLTEPTTVHWHGMELESVFDGVSGWSGVDAQRAPLVAPGDSFTVSLVPPRAGTYIYHTHMDEDDQLQAGLYGAMLVLEPGERFDPAADHVLVVGLATVDGRRRQTLNGRVEPPSIPLRAGRTHRLRLVSILPAAPVVAELTDARGRATWRPLAKDGAALPPSLTAPRPALQRIGVGETYDFAVTPDAAGTATLEVLIPALGVRMRQTFVVRE